MHPWHNCHSINISAYRMWGEGGQGKGQGLSLQDGTLHTYKHRLF